MISKFDFGDIVLLKFPFTDGEKAKKRPALVISDFLDGDIIVCRITSQIYSSKQDVYIDSWESTGLKLPSIIRVHKLATLDKKIVEKILGKIDESHKRKVKKVLNSISD